MSDIKVTRIPAVLKGRPDSVLLQLLRDDGKVKATVEVHPKLETLPHTDNFRVSILKGGPLSPEVSIQLTL